MTKEKGKTAPLAVPAANGAAFALGALAGLLLAGWLRTRGALSFARWMEGYALGVAVRGGGNVSFWQVAWNVLRWPLFVWLLGFTALGTWMVPVMFALRGFFLCFCVAALSGAAEGGFLLALLVFGLGDAVSLPALFYLGARSRTRAGARRRRLPADPRGRDLARAGLLFALLCGCAALEFWWMPALLERWLPLLVR